MTTSTLAINVPLIGSITQLDTVDYFYIDISNTAATIEQLTNSTLKILDVYPNPVSNQANFQFVIGKSEHVDFYIIDCLGKIISYKKIHAVTGVNKFQFDLSEFSAVTPASGDSFLTLDSDGSTEQLTTVSALQTYMQNNLTFTTDTNLTEEEVEDFVGGMLGGTETGITVTYQDSTGDIDFVVADTTVAGDSGSTGITPGDTLTIAGGTNVTTAMSGDTLTITATDTNTQLSTEQVQDIVGAMFTGNTETRITATYQDGDGTIDLVVNDMTANDNDDVSNANLLTALANLESSGGASNENITIGTDSGDTIVITGNLQVSGTTTTVNSTTVNLNDHNIVLDSGNSTSAVVDGAGITLEGGSGDDATFTYNASTNAFDFKLGSSFEDIKAAKFTGTELDISGNVDVDGTLEADAITVNGTALNSVIAGVTVSNATLAATVSVTDSTANTAFPLVFHNESNALLDDTIYGGWYNLDIDKDQIFSCIPGTLSLNTP